MRSEVLVLGAGFGGLELATILSAELGDDAGVTLIDSNDAFVFGYSKLDVMFGRTAPDTVKLHYADFAKPGIRFLPERVTAIDPEARRVTTDQGTHEGDALVIALGADYDFAATPGLRGGIDEFYSVRGAEYLRDVVANFSAGCAVVGVCGAPFKCPPAPSEAALLDAFTERGVEFVPGKRIASLDHDRKVAVCDDGSEEPFDLFLGVPKHRAPDVVQESGMAVDGYIPVDGRTLATSYPGVYAVGDVATVGVPKAGVFSERQARVVAGSLLEQRRGGEPPEPYDGRGSCYIEFGAGRVGRVDVEFFSGPSPVGSLRAPSEELVAEKQEFGSSRRARWFAL